VSKTKATPRFAWVIGGKMYLFCCPPCVDEFVQTAKEKPEEIKPPEEYRKK
jgi:YHS domain-containing protein